MELEDTATVPPEIIACPDPACLAPAEVVDRFTLASTDGPVEHVRTRCLDGHGFTARQHQAEEGRWLSRRWPAAS